MNTDYTPGEIRARIGVYVGLSIMASLMTSVLNLAAMSDTQLAAVSSLRWTLTILLAVFGSVVSGLTAFRAAIDRSTAGGTPATTTPAADTTNPPAVHTPTP